MKIIPIPEADLKFVKTTNAKICPKCNSTDIFDTGYRADNVDSPLIGGKNLHCHPIYRCKKCTQMFRVSKSQEC